MELLFADPGLQTIVESTVRSDARFGKTDGAVLRQRLCELIAADNLAIVATLPTLRVNRVDRRDGAFFVVTLRKGWRLVVEIAGPIQYVTGDGAIDLQKVQAIRIMTIEECDES